MSQTAITDNEYPVEATWILKIPVNFLITTVFISIFLAFILVPIGFLSSEGGIISLVVLGIIIATMVGIGFLSVIAAALSRENFHYSVEEDFMIFHQGVLTKQQKNLPYGVIQDVILSQDIVDKMFGLASLTIENASSGGGQVYVRGRAVGAWIGFVGNVATIPGLTKPNAETLKGIILKKMKENPYRTTSGL